MAYADQEGSIQDSTPYFLYEFNTPDSTIRYTDYPENISWNSQLWTSFPIKHSEVKQSNELSKNSLTVTIPLSGSLSDLFIGWSPDFSVTFTLRRGHFGSTDTLVYWKGRISSHNLKNQTIELKCESIFTSMRRAGIRARFQRNCRHALYGPGCNVDKNNFVLVGNVTGLTGVNLTVPEAATEADNWFLGGIAEFSDGSSRMITNHSGSTIVLTRPNRELSESVVNSGYGINYGNYYGGVSVLLYPGCDRTLSTCISKFDNLLNQGGFKWIPSKNPMGGSSII